MAGKNISVYGIYNARIDAENAAVTLENEGFRNTDVSVLFPENEGTKDFAHEKSTKAPEGISAGAAAGALMGGVLGWLSAMGVLAIPWVNQVMAAGPVMTALAGIGAGGTFGGIVGALIGMGIPEYEAKRFKGRIRRGGILLSVHCDGPDWTRRAKKVLRRTGAFDISASPEYRADYASSDKPMPRVKPSLQNPGLP